MCVLFLLLQSNLFNQPPLYDDHLSKATAAESVQANSHTVVTVWVDHLSNATSDLFFSLPNEKKTVNNNHYKTLPSVGKKHKVTMHKK